MSETLREKDETKLVGTFEAAALKQYITLEKQARQQALANRMSNVHRKAFAANRDLPDAKLFVEAHGREGSSTAWIPYTKTATELGEVNVSVRVSVNGHRSMLEMLVSDEETGTTHAKLGLVGVEFGTSGPLSVESSMPEVGSPKFKEMGAILSCMEDYIDTQTTSS